MQSFSAMNFTTTGGSIRDLGCNPIVSSSLRNGLHHLLRVFRLTPALSANFCLDIAFIRFKIFDFDKYLVCNCSLTRYQLKSS